MTECLPDEWKPNLGSNIVEGWKQKTPEWKKDMLDIRNMLECKGRAVDMPDLQEITNIEGSRNLCMKDLQEMERVLAGRCVPMRDIGLMENSLSARNIDMKDLECLQTI